MAANLDSVLTWKQACNQFEHIHLPVIKLAFEKDGVPDECARREAWNNWTDHLCKSGQISDWQYENWSQSPLCE